MVVFMIVYDLLSLCNKLNILKQSLLWFPTHISIYVHTLELSFINKCVPKLITISLTLFGLQDDI